MENLRRREIDSLATFQFQLAADARFSRTDYSDDQVWTLNLGSRGQPALALQTQYGGRAGLASLAPMWLIDGTLVYEHQSYAKPPLMTHFAPSYLRIEAAITPELALVAQYWAMESRAAGGEYRLTNHSNQAIQLQLDVFGHVVIKGRQRKLNVLTFRDDTLALHLGQIGDINPVLTLAGAALDVYRGHISSPKIGCQAALPAGESIRIPFAVAGMAEIRDSVSVAMNWMSRPWRPYFEQINLEAAALPKIFTGSDEWDKLIDLSYVQLMNAFMNATKYLPQPSFVANRASHRGWSRRGDGSDHIRAWAGQDPTLAYLTAAAIASIEGDFAKGMVLNYLAGQDESGFVDRQPGLGGQRQGLLMMPLLARLAWMIYQQTEDRQFILDIFPRLLAFFKRWFEPDMDADGDGAPEWQTERQMGYVAFPTFGSGQAWAQGASIQQMETPDLLAYLISEADALHQMAQLLEETLAQDDITQQLKQLESHLGEFWDGSRYAYRDRDSHLSGAGTELLGGGRGDEIHWINQSLATPERVLIRVVGGVSQRPRIRLRLQGKDEAGHACRIEAAADDFFWHNRQGIYATRQTLSHIDSIEVRGLSRVYKVYAQTPDSSRLDVNHLLPLWTGRLPTDHAQSLAALAMDANHFMRPNGLTMISASDPDFDPSNARGGGGIWMYWLSLIGEGLVKSGFRAEATRLIKAVLECLSQTLKKDGHLSQFYHTETSTGFGEAHHIGGIVPLYLLSEVMGIRIVSRRKVWVGGEFTWEQDIKVEQHGVTVTRSAEHIQVDFPSGHSETLAADVSWQALTDPMPGEDLEEIAELPSLPAVQDADSAKRVVIEVEGDAEAAQEPEEPQTDLPAGDDRAPSD